VYAMSRRVRQWELLWHLAAQADQVLFVLQCTVRRYSEERLLCKYVPA